MNISDLTQIARTKEFQHRIEYLMVEKALAVADGSPTASESALIQKILNGSEPLLPWSVAAVTNSTIAAGTHTLDGATITDSALQTQIGAQWDVFTQ